MRIRNQDDITLEEVHLEVKHDAWLDSIEEYENVFGYAVGRPASLADVAERMELQHLKDVSACRRAFT